MAEILEDEIITATAASRAFSELLHRVCYGGESFVIKKGQRLMARIVPVVEAEMQQSKMQSAEETIPVPMIDETIPENITGDEAEFYRAWMEQVRKVEA